MDRLPALRLSPLFGTDFHSFGGGGFCPLGRGSAQPLSCLSLLPQHHDVTGGGLAFYNRSYMRGPRVKCRTFFGGPIVPLIDASNAAAAAADMVQNGLRHFEPHTKPLQAGSDGAAQIVHVPWNEPRQACAGYRGAFGAGISDRRAPAWPSTIPQKECLQLRAAQASRLPVELSHLRAADRFDAFAFSDWFDALAVDVPAFGCIRIIVRDGE